MQTFKDDSGKDWTINLTIGKAKIIKSRFDIDFVGDDPGVVSANLHDNPLTRMSILFELVVNKDGVTQEEFDDSIGTESYRRADATFWKEFENFTVSLEPSRGEAISRLLNQMRKVSAAQVDMMVALASNPAAVKSMERVVKATAQKAEEEMEEMVLEFEDPKNSIKDISESVIGRISTG